MLPMNKVCEDIKAFLIQRENEEKVVVKTAETRQTELVLFANELSEKHGEHVDIKLVKSLIVNIDSMRLRKRLLDIALGKGGICAVS